MGLADWDFLFQRFFIYMHVSFQNKPPKNQVLFTRYTKCYVQFSGYNTNITNILLHFTTMESLKCKLTKINILNYLNTLI